MSYILIYIHVRKHFQSQQQTLHLASNISRDVITNEIGQRSISRDKIGDSYPVSTRSGSRKETLSRQQIQITKNLSWVVCAFFACFLPYFILEALPPHTFVDHIIFYVRLSPQANSAINFFIYANKHPDFKIVLGHMMKRSYGDIPQPSRFLKLFLKKEN